MKKSAEEIILVKEWLKFAEENLLLAHSGMREEFAPYHTICYLCQGSAEKYLKGFLIWNGWKLRKIHDLIDLPSEDELSQLSPEGKDVPVGLNE